VLLNYHIGRFVLSPLCVGDLVRLGLSSARVAGFSLQHGHYLTFPQPITVLNHINLILHSHLYLGTAGGFLHYLLKVLWILDKFLCPTKYS